VIYVPDTSVISALHRNYYRDRFPSLWKRFDEMTAGGLFTSTRESFRELEESGGAAFEWAEAHSGIFMVPDAREGAFVARIYAVKHFQANIARQKILKGGKNADPFLIARAAAVSGTVVTMEKFRENAAKIRTSASTFRSVASIWKGLWKLNDGPFK
jgi:hypothetical protein